MPTLVLDDGAALYDSPVICAYLDTIGDAPPLAPASDWDVRRREAAGDGLCELAVKLRFEQLRAEGERSPRWQARWRENIVRTLDVGERDPGLADGFDVGVIAWGCALAYLDFRHGGDIAWREGRPVLTGLMQRLDLRASFIETRP